jgi:hypothetical protein
MAGSGQNEDQQMSVYRRSDKKDAVRNLAGKSGRETRKEKCRVMEDSRPGSILRDNPDYMAIMATIAAEAAKEETASR